MKILHRYLLSQFFRMFGFTLLTLTSLFLVFDFFDRFDKIYASDSSPWTAVQYFLYKVPTVGSITLPIAALTATMLTVGLMSKNSEITAMRASGLRVLWITKPILVAVFFLSLFAMVLNETLIPFSTRRVKEIYNIDIRKKDESGGYSQRNVWWRANNHFYSIDMFDSRTDTLLDLKRFTVGKDFEVRERLDAQHVTWVDKLLGWSMHGVEERLFRRDGKTRATQHPTLPLPMPETPQDFYSANPEPLAMNYRDLSAFIRKQEEAGLTVRSYLADLYAKLSFPFVTFISCVVVLPFALRSARSGSMAVGFMAGLIIAFSYYAVHSLSIALGRAELWPALLAAWMANIVLGIVGIILNLGAEAPE